MVALTAAAPEPSPRQPSAARLEWLKLKAEVEHEAKAKARAARLEILSKRKSLKNCSASTRAFYETQRDLAEHWRNRRRWEEN